MATVTAISQCNRCYIVIASLRLHVHKNGHTSHHTSQWPFHLMEHFNFSKFLHLLLSYFHGHINSWQKPATRSNFTFVPKCQHERGSESNYFNGLLRICLHPTCSSDSWANCCDSFLDSFPLNYCTYVHSKDQCYNCTYLQNKTSWRSQAS